MKILVVDVGGNHVKLLATGQPQARKLESGPELDAARMVAAVRQGTEDWIYDAVAIGYPGPVLKGKIALEPHNLAPGWVDFDMAKAFGCPVKLINDAAMQALGSYQRGTMLFLGLGTGLGSCLVAESTVFPLELAHLPYKKSTYEEHVGRAALDQLGKKWREQVEEIVAALRAAFLPDDIVLGGGNAKKLKEVPEGCRLGANTNAFLGGFRLWDPNAAAPVLFEEAAE